MDILPGKSVREAKHDHLEAWREQVEQAWRQQEHARAFAQASADAYIGFLGSLFSYYHDVRAAERSSRER